MVTFYNRSNGKVEANLTKAVESPEQATEIDENGDMWLLATLTDNDHQSLIETLNAIWGDDWQDGTQWLKKFRRDHMEAA